VVCLPIEVFSEYSNSMGQSQKINIDVQEYLKSKGLKTLSGNDMVVSSFTNFIVIIFESKRTYYTFYDTIEGIKGVYNNPEILDTVTSNELLNGDLDYMFDANKLGLLWNI